MNLEYDATITAPAATPACPGTQRQHRYRREPQITNPTAVNSWHAADC
jgi:hypothetical protein